MKKRTLAISMLFTLMCFLPAFSANPFGEEEIFVPVNIQIEQPLEESAPINSVGLIASAAFVASDTSSLWKDLTKLYGTLGKRVGKRKSNNDGEVAEHHLDGYDNMDIDIDGENYCGQFAMSTLLNGMGIDTDPQKVYQDSNPAGIFTSPPAIVEYLRMNGIKAKLKNKASVKNIAKRIDDGNPVMVLVDSGDGIPHWVCITGYDTDDSGNIVSLRMRDSYWGTNGPHTMSIADFEKAWNSPFGKGTLSDLVGYSNVLIDNYGTCPPDSTPPIYPGSFDTATEDNMASGINDVVTGWKNHSVAQVIGGASKLVIGLPSAITGVVSNFADKQSQNLISWGETKMDEGGLGNKIIGGAALATGVVTNSIANAGRAVSNAWSSQASIIGNGIKKLGSLFSRN